MWQTLTHLVRAVDFCTILQQKMHYVGMASACCPNDGVDTVLLGYTGAHRTEEEESLLDGCLQYKFTKQISSELTQSHVFLIKLETILHFKNTNIHNT